MVPEVDLLHGFATRATVYERLVQFILILQKLISHIYFDENIQFLY